MKRDEEIDRLQRRDAELGAGRAEPPRPVRSLIESDTDSGVDEEDQLVGEEDLRLDETISAEEAAIRIVNEPPGANYDPDPGYIEDEG